MLLDFLKMLPSGKQHKEIMIGTQTITNDPFLCEAK